VIAEPIARVTRRADELLDDLIRSNHPIPPARSDTTPGANMTYLIVGLDHRMHTPWHRNLRERDVTSAARAAVARARADGVDLVVAAVVGPGSSVLDGLADRPARLLTAA
jgi:hypothetical protein